MERGRGKRIRRVGRFRRYIKKDFKVMRKRLILFRGRKLRMEFVAVGEILVLFFKFGCYVEVELVRG